MAFEFTKMHGLGNDFAVIDATVRPFSLSNEQIRLLAERRTGIGFDQMLVVEKATDSEAEFNYRIFNSDGSEVEHCGNGARCFAQFVIEKGLTTSSEIPVMTSGGLLRLQLETDGQVTVAMGIPEFEPQKVPFVAEHRAPAYTLQLADNDSRQFGVLAIGNPHAVTWCDDVESLPLDELGPLIENHPRFPNRVNAGFAQIVDRQQVRVRVFERGVGETLACGTGACAAMVHGVMQDLLDDEVTVRLRGGELRIRWQGEGRQVYMTGPCTTVFDGTTELL